MVGKRLGYIRVSTLDQNPDRQLDGVSLDKKFIDYASGTTINRPHLAALMEYMRDEDEVFVHSMDRLARNVKDLLELVEKFSQKRVSLHFLKEGLSFKGEECHLSKLLLVIMGAVAQFEHSLLMERQREGIQLAKKRGMYKGRKKKLDAHKMELLKDLLGTRASKTQIAKELGVSRAALYNYMRKLNP